LSHSTMHDALLTERRKTLMPDSRAHDPQGSDFRLSVTSVSEEPATPAAVEEFLQALPAITHELSEALTAVSTYLAGSRHLFEHGTRFDKIQSAIEQADLQARRRMTQSGCFARALANWANAFDRMGRSFWIKSDPEGEE
jgi:hypothetical protein